MKQKLKIVKRYKATDGAQFSKEKAQVYGEALDEIAQRNNGTLKPKDIVEDARDEDNPLHDYFNWDDDDAGEKWRIYQARNLINHITLVVKYDGQQKEQKAFFSVQSTPNDDENKNITYVNIERVMGESQLRSQIVKRALEELEYWELKYKEYSELNKLFVFIDKVKRKIIEKISQRIKAKAKQKKVMTAPNY